MTAGEGAGPGRSLHARACVTVADPKGLHARVSVGAWKAAARHRSEVSVTVRGRTYRPTGSLLGWVLALCFLRALPGEIVTVVALGPDAEAAASAVGAELGKEHGPEPTADDLIVGRWRAWGWDRLADDYERMRRERGAR